MVIPAKNGMFVKSAAYCPYKMQVLPYIFAALTACNNSGHFAIDSMIILPVIITGLSISMNFLK